MLIYKGLGLGEGQWPGTHRHPPQPPPGAQEESPLHQGGNKGGGQEGIYAAVSTCFCKSGNEAKKAAGKDESLDKKSANKKEKGSRGKTGGSVNHKTKKDLSAENGDAKESPASDEVGEKEAKSD